MNYQEIYKIVKETFLKNEDTIKRFKHIEGVIDEAVKLNRYHSFGLDEEKVKLAALLHDYAKSVEKEKLIPSLDKIIEENKDDPYFSDLYDYPSIWHSFVGAKWAKERFPSLSDDIIEAIKYHTTGKPKMSLLTKIIYISDCIEVGRDYEFVEIFRKKAYTDFDGCLIDVLQDTIRIVKNKGRIVHPLTQDTLEYYLKGDY